MSALRSLTRTCFRMIYFLLQWPHVLQYRKLALQKHLCPGYKSIALTALRRREIWSHEHTISSKGPQWEEEMELYIISPFPLEPWHVGSWVLLSFQCQSRAVQASSLAVMRPAKGPALWSFLLPEFWFPLVLPPVLSSLMSLILPSNRREQTKWH